MLKRNKENFPVASRLLPEDARAPVWALYDFARGSDDMADDAKVPASKRQQELMALEKALVANDRDMLPDFALPYAELASKNPALLKHARVMLSAFMQDTVKSRYRDYNELLDYCQRAAVPAGAAFFMLCEENKVDMALIEPFCIALQLLNHIQDAADDYVNRGIVYLPLAWFTLAKTDVQALADSECSAGIRQVLNHGLDNCEKLLKKSARLASTLSRKGVAREVAWIHLMAQELCIQLRKRDPLSKRVRVGKIRAIGCLIQVMLSL